MHMKAHMIAALREQFTRWEEVLASLTPEQITAPHHPSAWSIKDEIAHLWAWQQRSLARVEAALRDREPEFPAWPAEFDPEVEEEPDQLNAWLYQQYQEQPWSIIYPQWRTGFLQFLALAEKVSERKLLDAGAYPWLEGHPLALSLLGTYDHHQEHLEHLLARLPASR